MNIGWALLHVSHLFIRAKESIYYVPGNVLRAVESCEQERIFWMLSVQRKRDKKDKKT